MQPLAAILLIAYTYVLPIKGTATLQFLLVCTSFTLLLWDRRHSLAASWNQAYGLLSPLLFFSIWVFMISPFWGSGEGLGPKLNQPWFSLNLWRRDIGQPMVAMLSSYWAFRELKWKRILFSAQALFIGVLLMKGGYQYYHGEIIDGLLRNGTLFVRGFSRDNNFFGYVLFLLTPGMFWLVLGRRKGWRGWAYLIVMFFLFYLIFITKRRGTWIALFVEMLIIAFWMGKRVWIPFVLASLLLVATAFQLRPEWFHRGYDRQDIGRTIILEKIPPLLVKHPWVGVGFGKDTVVKNYWHLIYEHAHNQFINLTLGLGYPGLLLWIGTLSVYSWRCWKFSKDDWLGIVGLAFLIGFCVRNLTDDIWISSNAELFWFLMGVFLSADKTSEEKLQTEEKIRQNLQN